MNIEETLKRRTRMFLTGISFMFLFLHAGLLLFFINFGVKPMAIFNVFSIIFYCLSFYLISKGYFHPYLMATYFEVLLHMMCAVYFCGWDAGFQVTIIGMTVFAFFGEYMSILFKFRHIPATRASLIGLTIYIITFLISLRNKAPYQLPEKICIYTRIGWAVITFLVMIFLLKVMVMHAEEYESYLNEMAEVDELTNLNNRYAVDHYIKTNLTAHPEHYWISIIDIDNFKQINDTYGHNYGDYVLKTVADLMRENLNNQFICRWGGEEFLIIGLLNPDITKAFETMDNFRKIIENYDFNFEGVHIRLTISGGIAIKAESHTIGNWIDKADEKLYEVKQSGKNRILY